MRLMVCLGVDSPDEAEATWSPIRARLGLGR